MTQLTCPGEIVTDVDGSALCVDGVGQPIAWVVQPAFDVSQLSSADLGAAWAAGFVVIGTGMCIGMGFRAVLNFIR